MRKDGEEEKIMLSITEAAKFLSVSNGAIRQAMRLNRLHPVKPNGRNWAFSIDQLNEYKNNRYSRKVSKFNGALLFDKSKGEYSVGEVSNLLGCGVQHLYYACRKNKIRTEKKGYAWVIHIDDINEYRKVMKLGKKRASKERIG
ncbi:MAG TPA: helix-turn-helix domain-containing protein [Candidatus Nitrosotalea sp.]|nr:helix-turn-helix domain-containing protein [Candidatus Nitrosotalea sp.]